MAEPPFDRYGIIGGSTETRCIGYVGNIMTSMERGSPFSVLAEAATCLNRIFTPKPHLPSVDEICGTWVNPNQNPQKLIMSPDGTWKSFDHVSDTTPSNGGTFQVTKKWKDANGNTFYHDDFTLQIDGKTRKAQELLKVHKGGKSGESTFQIVEQFDSKNYPKALDSKSPNYLTFFAPE